MKIKEAENKNSRVKRLGRRKSSRVFLLLLKVTLLEFVFEVNKPFLYRRNGAYYPNVK